ncbi:molybdopterin-dependent oxidoreductase [Roseomonas sp. JC162]|uniref:Molybdopterin-dependent oxidoreductase n=1 Tax=Neoroseomonas marina TaxID=1232220 RepID=A0A848EE47_9PROT|nr:molybdopterin cofactor-binding domain-containing protein [Neoroseomonas marina]NMJ42864.1 molybdopterin-dependent oxidoreductase [Neoroseomonas marina]
MTALTVNGTRHEVDADPFAPLSDTLRVGLGLTGTKEGCNAGDCGACTVLLEGAQVCACLVATAQAEGAEITTVEADDPLLDTLRAAFLARGAAQCGICTPGMLMAALDLLRRNATPDRRAVEDTLGGVLCRCTGYLQIIDAVLDVARGNVAPAATDGRVGASFPRVDGAPKVAGTERYGADAAPDDALWLRAVRSPHAHARFTLGDLDAARDQLGLVAILSARDVPGRNAFGIMPDIKDQPVFAEGYVRYRGEAVLGLLGTREAVAAVRDADLPIAWEVLPALSGVAAALAPDAAQLHAHAPGNILVRGHLRRGDAEATLAAAPVRADGTFRTSFVEHAYIEPEAGYAQPGEDGAMIITACTQAPVMDREETARVLGVPDESVRIIPTACGGGFGGKLDVSVQPLLAVAARVTNQPVRMVYSRAESMASSTKRHPAILHARMAADAEGRFTAYALEGDFNTGAYASWGPTVANRVPVHASGPYRVPNVLNRTRAVYTNDTPAGAFRGFGVPQAAIATEALVDDLALALGMDRWEIRRRNAIGKGDTTPSGQVLHASAGLPDCLDALKADWDAMLARVAAHNATHRRLRLGAGIACMWYGCGNTALSNPSTMRITLARDGTLTLFNGAVDIGQGSTTVIGQIAADALGLPIAALRQVVGDTALTPDAGKTSASRQTFVSGRAAQDAAKALRARILALANAGDGARLSLDGTRLTVADAHTTRILDLVALDADLTAEARYDPPTVTLDADGQGVPYATYGFAAQVALVRVDTALGTVKVEEIVVAQDVGRAVNPLLVAGQIHGGVAQGLGLVLMEEFIPGRTENLHDYLIPTAGDMPRIRIHLVEDPEPEGPLGAKGVGEPALVPTAPAILSAIRHATGVRMTEVPVLPHRLMERLGGGEPPPIPLPSLAFGV